MKGIVASVRNFFDENIVVLSLCAPFVISMAMVIALVSMDELENPLTQSSSRSSSSSSNAWKLINTHYYVATHITEESRREPSHFNGKTWIYSNVPYYIVKYYAVGISTPFEKEFDDKNKAHNQAESSAYIREDVYENINTGALKTETTWSG